MTLAAPFLISAAAASSTALASTLTAADSPYA